MSQMILVGELRRPEYEELLAARGYVSIAARLNERAEVKNPDERAQTLKRLALADIFAAIVAVAPGDLAKVRLVPGWMVDRAEASMQANDRAAMAHWLSTIAVSAEFSPATQSALVALLGETEPDPAWQATVLEPSLAMKLGLGRVSELDVQRAHHELGG